MDCEKCKIDRYKELLKRRSAKIEAQAETIHELQEELRQICHENEMLWRYRMGDRTSDASRHKAEREKLEARLDEALAMMDVLTRVLKVLVKKEEKDG